MRRGKGVWNWEWDWECVAGSRKKKKSPAFMKQALILIAEKHDLRLFVFLIKKKVTIWLHVANCKGMQVLVRGCMHI